MENLVVVETPKPMAEACQALEKSVEETVRDIVETAAQV